MLEEPMDNRVDAGGNFPHSLMITVTIILPSMSVAMRCSDLGQVNELSITKIIF